MALKQKLTDQRQARLARQIEAVLAQEEALDRRRDQVREREHAVEQKEREFASRRGQAEAELARRATSLDAREARIAERERALDAREQALDEVARKKARALAREALSLAERNKEVTRREAIAGAPAPGPVDEASQSFDGPSARHSRPPEATSSLEDTAEIALPAAPSVPAEGWNLNRLERLVDERGREFPARLDEWRYYLLYLREFADAHGNLPRPFDWLVWSEFEELVSRAA